MSLTRFYVAPETVELKHDFWLHDENLREKISKILNKGDEVVLFDGVGLERLYKLTEVELDGIHLEMATEFERKLPKKHIYLFWALQAIEKNDAILLECTELGVSNFVPLISENSAKNFDIEYYKKVLIYAAEAGEWSMVPHIREALSIETALQEYKGKVQLMFYDVVYGTEKMHYGEDSPRGVIIGPEIGWTKTELELFRNENLESFHLDESSRLAEGTSVALTKLLTQYLH